MSLCQPRNLHRSDNPSLPLSASRLSRNSPSPTTTASAGGETPDGPCLREMRMDDVGAELARDRGERDECPEIGDRRYLAPELGHSSEREALSEAAELEHAPLGRRLRTGDQKRFEPLRVE